MKQILIQDFFLKKNSDELSLHYKLNNKWLHHTFIDDFEEFLINSNSDNFDGIIININNKNNSYQIKTSIIGSINVFHCISGENIYLGTDLDYLINQSRYKKSYNLTKLYDYFVLSYHALDEKTIYNGINIIPKNSIIKANDQIQIKTDISEKIYSNLNYDVHFDDVLDSLISFSKSTLSNSKFIAFIWRKRFDNRSSFIKATY